MQRRPRGASPRVRKAPPAWQARETERDERWAAYDEQPETGYEEPVVERYDSDDPQDGLPYEEDPFFEEPIHEPQVEIIATNTAVRLTCTLCAMCGLLAAFMCWAEKESRAIRHFALQSVAVTALHLLIGLLLLAVANLLGGVPFLGFMVTMVCWLCYIALLIALLVVRARMMLHAWRGVRFRLPGLWRALERFE